MTLNSTYQLALTQWSAGALSNPDGSQRRGTPLSAAFWDGFNGLSRSANAIPGTLSYGAFRAGRRAATLLKGTK